MKNIKVSELVKIMEENSEKDSQQLSELKATLIFNFGENGRCCPNLIDGSETPLAAMIIIIEYYINRLKSFT